MHKPPIVDFDKSPFLILWELTRACALACKHCRATALKRRNPNELSTREIAEQLDEIKKFGSPLIVLTGGDPIERPDVYEIISEAKNRGFHIALTPSATPSVTSEVVFKLKSAGLERLAISLDGSTAQSHDSFRGIAGSYQHTMNIMRWAAEASLPLQVNTTLWKDNFEDFDDISKLVKANSAVLWSLFFLVPTGRARATMQISPQQAESVMCKMAEMSASKYLSIKSTAAPHYRRVLIEKNGEKYYTVNDGKGLLFISHVGDVLPSGFLPIAAGNVREQSVVDIYRSNEMFKELRSPELLKGKCGRCPFKKICGGSRARAYADTGDYLEADSLCAYQPN
jgi:radical SAM protein with 4Fe4S-binding SPASM domain